MEAINSLGMPFKKCFQTNVVLGLKTHQKVIKKTQDEKNPPKKSTKGDKHELTSNDLIVGDSSKYKSKVRFRAHPLEIQEIFNGTSNSTSLGKFLTEILIKAASVYTLLASIFF